MSITIRFQLRSKTDDQTQIHARIHVNEGPHKYDFVFSTGESVAPKRWDTRKQRIRPDSGKDSVTHYRNRALEMIRDDIGVVFYEYKTERRIKELTREVFKSELSERIRGHSSKVSLIDFLRKEASERKVKDRKNYSLLLKYIEEFSKERSSDFSDLNKLWYKAFEKWLYAPPRSLQAITVRSTIGNLKAVLRSAESEGLAVRDDYRQVSIKARPRNHCYLTMSEIEQLHGFEITKPHLVKYKDAFVLHCFTGLRFSDWSKAVKENIKIEGGAKILVAKTQKTGNNVAIPLHRIALEILEKYDYRAFPFNYKSSYLVNLSLKEICKAAGLDAPFTQSDYAAGVEVSKEKKKHEVVSTHTARRSFCTNLFLAGVPHLDICKMSGHRTPAVLLDYIKAEALESAIKVSKNSFFSGLKVV